MTGRFTTGLIVAFLGAGVSLFAMNELGTVPRTTLLVYFGLWLAVGIVGIVLLRPRSPRSERSTAPNPFERMWDSERERARAILDARLAGREVPSEDSNWLSILLERYAPLLSQSQQMDKFAEYLASVPAAEKWDTADAVAGPARVEASPGAEPDEDPHDGPSVVLARARRRPGFDVTRDGTSWFGGLPALGEQSWPLDDGGRPMTPLAQIDLTGLAEHLKVPGLPDSGSLAFFAALPESDDWQGRVVHVQLPSVPTQPLRPLRPVQDHSLGGPLRKGEPGEDQRLYPRTAIELVRVGASRLSDEEAFVREVEAALGPGRDGSLDVELLQTAAKRQRPWNRDSLLRFLHGARLSLGAGEKAEASLRKTEAEYSKRVASLTETLAKTDVPDRAALQSRLDNVKGALKGLQAILADVPAATRRLVEELDTLELWAGAGDRWQPLTEAEQQVLDPLLAAWTEPSSLGWALLHDARGVHRRMADCVRETLLVLAVAPDRDYAVLPEPVREAVEGPWRQPYFHRNHQMFGGPDSIQTAAEDNAQARMLLQLQCDDIAGFHWGDMGVLQFWIRPADLEAGHWDRAYMTFEGH